MPPAPTRIPAAAITASSSRTPSDSNTTPRAGSVSSQENGGATNAASAPTMTSAPKAALLTRLPNNSRPRGRDHRSSQRTNPSKRLSNRARFRPASETSRQRRGSQTVSRPMTSWSASSIAIASRMCVAPPVGMGSAGTLSSTTNSTAKLFSPNASTMLPTVWSPPASSQSESWSLNRGSTEFSPA